jgi:hypothetical protein
MSKRKLMCSLCHFEMGWDDGYICDSVEHSEVMEKAVSGINVCDGCAGEGDEPLHRLTGKCIRWRRL